MQEAQGNIKGGPTPHFQRGSLLHDMRGGTGSFELIRDLNSITTVVHAVSTKVESQSCGLCVVIEVACKEKTSMQKLCMYKNEPDTRGG